MSLTDVFGYKIVVAVLLLSVKTLDISYYGLFLYYFVA
jgi:hypothetical protein